MVEKDFNMVGEPIIVPSMPQNGAITVIPGRIKR
jgi:hypothetical protein